MKLAVMQPYIFPYLGYFHLIMSSDVFVVYDDVSFIKQSYINRNNIALGGNKHRFSIPVPKSSSNIMIKDLEYDDKNGKLLKTISQAYAKAPYYDAVFLLLKNILAYENKSINIFCMNSFLKIFEYLGVTKKIVLSSSLEYDRNAKASEKLISMCNIFDADTYINSPGGRELYDESMFSPHGVDLKFIRSELKEYKQVGCIEFIAGLSIIDVLMNNSIQDVISLLDDFTCED